MDTLKNLVDDAIGDLKGYLGDEWTKFIEKKKQEFKKNPRDFNSFEEYFDWDVLLSEQFLDKLSNSEELDSAIWTISDATVPSDKTDVERIYQDNADDIKNTLQAEGVDTKDAQSPKAMAISVYLETKMNNYLQKIRELLPSDFSKELFN